MRDQLGVFVLFKLLSCIPVMLRGSGRAEVWSGTPPQPPPKDVQKQPAHEQADFNKQDSSATPSRCSDASSSGYRLQRRPVDGNTSARCTYSAHHVKLTGQCEEQQKHMLPAKLR